ncbi:hypothetical protein PMAYCL1PPCAC_03219 [Pristionchus mayeri]|uniref:Uncharacterized protein n=1 Tax=Pristionchus mayeri TaxID=1317129 RepID=A0AAN4Z497_9BILA|nr:hypothetical protein PMAYCL1PPCAC_03219 [Pristionchus mayeri]
MEEAKNGSTERATQIDSLKKALTNVLDVVQDHEKLIKSKASAPQSSNPIEEATSIPPWDKLDEERPVHTKKEEVAPWESNEKFSESAATNQHEPWNDITERRKKEIVGANKTELETADDQKENKKVQSAKNEKITAAVKPVSRNKNWDAICREFSDSEEEVEEVAAIPKLECSMTPEEEVESAALFATDAIGLLSMYCSALDNGKYSLLKLREYPLETMISYEAHMSPSNPCFGNIKGTLRKELRRLSEMPLYCHVCNLLLAAPFHLFMHLLDKKHIEIKNPHLTQYHHVYMQLNSFIAFTFHRFIGAPEQPIFQESMHTELRLMDRGREFAKISPRYPVNLRPTGQFMEKIMKEVADGITLSIDVPAEALADVRPANLNEALKMKAIGAQLRAYLPHGNNRKKLAAKFEKHLAEGLAGCRTCEVAFESADEYYQHITSYGHSIRDQTMFTAFMVQWKGQGYWNTMV